MMEIWRERVLWQGYVHPHSHIQLKKSGTSHTHIHTYSMREFPVNVTSHLIIKRN